RADATRAVVPDCLRRSCARSPVTLGEAAAGAARTDTFLGARYRRIARHRGKKKAIVAVGRSILSQPTVAPAGRAN
ncbi:MAG: hypothetical protein WCG47_19430, partial [Dermatophilaceae bacterium]